VDNPNGGQNGGQTHSQAKRGGLIRSRRASHSPVNASAIASVAHLRAAGGWINAPARRNRLSGHRCGTARGLCRVRGQDEKSTDPHCCRLKADISIGETSLVAAGPVSSDARGGSGRPSRRCDSAPQQSLRAGRAYVVRPPALEPARAGAGLTSVRQSAAVCDTVAPVSGALGCPLLGVASLSTTSTMLDTGAAPPITAELLSAGGF
jgi:hypothetical protein